MNQSSIIELLRVSLTKVCLIANQIVIPCTVYMTEDSRLASEMAADEKSSRSTKYATPTLSIEAW
jgi:hypothetical protein